MVKTLLILLMCLFSVSGYATSLQYTGKIDVAEIREIKKKDVRRLYYFLENWGAEYAEEKTILSAYFNGAQTALEIHYKMQEEFNNEHQSGYEKAGMQNRYAENWMCLPDPKVLSAKLNPNLLSDLTRKVYLNEPWRSEKNRVYSPTIGISLHELKRQYPCPNSPSYSRYKPSKKWSETIVTPRTPIKIENLDSENILDMYSSISLMSDYVELKDAPDSLRKRRYEAFLLGAQDSLNQANILIKNNMRSNYKLRYDNNLNENNVSWLCATESDLTTLTSAYNKKIKLFPRLLNEMYEKKPELYNKKGNGISIVSVIMLGVQAEYKCDNQVGKIQVPNIT